MSTSQKNIVPVRTFEAADKLAPFGRVTTPVRGGRALGHTAT